jgi:hypothetical protein
MLTTGIGRNLSAEAVAGLTEALYYKSEIRCFDFQWSRWIL